MNKTLNIFNNDFDLIVWPNLKSKLFKTFVVEKLKKEIKKSKDNK